MRIPIARPVPQSIAPRRFSGGRLLAASAMTMALSPESTTLTSMIWMIEEIQSRNIIHPQRLEVERALAANWNGMDRDSRKNLRDPSGERLEIAYFAEAEEHYQPQLDRHDQGEWRMDHEEHQAEQDPHAKGLHQQRSIEDHSF